MIEIDRDVVLVREIVRNRVNAIVLLNDLRRHLIKSGLGIAISTMRSKEMHIDQLGRWRCRQ